MKNFVLGLSLSFAFIVGCVAGQSRSSEHALASANAQAPQGRSSYEYRCVSYNPGPQVRAQWTQNLTTDLPSYMAAKGWELVTFQGRTPCFKRAWNQPEAAGQRVGTIMVR